MSVTGRIAVDVQFADAEASAGVSSLKSITLQDATEYASGKVAIVTGTCGTAEVTISIAPSAYKDASGSAASFSSVTRVAFAASPAASLQHADLTGGDSQLGSRGGRVSVAESINSGPLAVSTTAGTASYTIVLYGT